MSSLQILIIIVEPADQLLILRSLQSQVVEVRCVCVHTAEGLARALEGPIDAVITEFDVPGMNFGENIELIRSHVSNPPVILVSGRIDEETAMIWLREGLGDFVRKDRLAHLGFAVERAVFERRLKARLPKPEVKAFTFFTAAAEAMLMIDEKYRIVLFNPAAEAMFEYTVAEVFNQPLDLLLHEKVRSGQAARIRNFSLRDGASSQMRAMNNVFGKRKSGAEFPLEVSVSSYATDGKTGFIAIIRDISDQIRLESDSALLAAIVRNAGVAIVSYDLEEKITSWNRGAERMFGFSEEEVIGQPVKDLVSSKDRRGLIRLEGHSNTEDTMTNFETRCQHKDGHLFDVSFAASEIRNSAGVIVGISAFVTDITERRRSQTELKRSRETLLTAQRRANIGNWEVDWTLQVVQISQEMARINGLDPLTGCMALEGAKGCINIVHPDDRDMVRESLRAATVEHRTIVFEHRMLFPDGRIKWLRSYIEPQAGGEGTFTTLLGTSQDITEHKLYEVQLTESAERLQGLSASLLHIQEEERISIARELHDEFGQTLTALKLHLAVLSKKRSYELGECLEITDHALAQVRSLSLNLHPPQLQDLGLEVTLRSYCQRLARQTGIDIGFGVVDARGHPADDRFRIWGSAATVGFRVVQESMTNAMRHAKAKVITVTMKIGNDKLGIIVADDGVGFDVPSKMRFAPGSAGLGLLSMQARVRPLNGSVEFASAPGKGTTVSINIPLSDRDMELK